MVQRMVMPLPTPKKTRQSRLERNPKAVIRPLELIERGIETLLLLDKARFATNDQVETTFESKTKTGRPRSPKGAEFACNRALRELFDGGWVDRIWVLLPRGDYKHYKEGYVNVLTPKGMRAVAAHLPDDEYPTFVAKNRPVELRPLVHPFAIVEFFFRARVACRHDPWLFGGWMDDKELAARKEAGFGFTNVPDGFFVISNTETDRDWPFFLEMDLGSTSIIAYTERKDWVRKILGYVAYIKRGYAHDFPELVEPVVLIVTPANRRGDPYARRDLILEAIGEGKGGGRYWVTTFDDLNAHGFWGKIWAVRTSPELRSLFDRCSQ